MIWKNPKPNVKNKHEITYTGYYVVDGEPIATPLKHLSIGTHKEDIYPLFEKAFEDIKIGDIVYYNSLEQWGIIRDPAIFSKGKCTYYTTIKKDSIGYSADPNHTHSTLHYSEQAEKKVIYAIV